MRDVKVSQILDGKYRVERILGAGDEAVTVVAHRIEPGDEVALKLWAPEIIGTDEAALHRFRANGRVAQLLRSEHVARVTAVDALSDGTPYVEMEPLDGLDLAMWCKDRGALPVGQAVEFVMQACVGVAEAHAQGVVHRYLRPSSLFCVQRPDGTPSIKVLDFGIHRNVVSLASEVRYQAPEQVASAWRDVGVPTDVWALGSTLFELLAGRPPFGGATLSEAALQVVTQPVPPLRAVRRDAPAGLEGVIARCLEKDCRKRFGSVEELARSLAQFRPTRAVLT